MGRKSVQQPGASASKKAWKLAGELADYCAWTDTALVWKRMKYIYRAFRDSKDDALRIVALAVQETPEYESERHRRFVLSMNIMWRYVNDEKTDPQEILFLAVCADDPILAEIAVEAGADFRVGFIDELSMLALACKLGNPKTIRWILAFKHEILITKKFAKILDGMIARDENADEARAVKAAFEAQQISKKMKKPRKKVNPVSIRV